MKSHPKPLEGLLSGALGHPEVLRTAAALRAMARWDEAVGDLLAKKSRPERFDAGKVWVAVESSSWAQEMRMRGREILSRLNQISGSDLFTEVVFRVKALPNASAFEQADVSPVEAEDIDVHFFEPALQEIGKRVLGRLEGMKKRTGAETRKQ